MRILHATARDSGGGAAIAAGRLHCALRDRGMDSRMVVGHRTGTLPYVSTLGGKFSRRILAPLFSQAERMLRQRVLSFPEHQAYTTFSILPSLQHRRLNIISKDLLHLHWLGEDFLTPLALARLRGPIVWTMHDTWPFTGGCHFTSTGCTRYLERCGQCPELCSRREHDLSRLHWLAKRRAVQRVLPVIVSPSAEYAKRATQSGLLKDCRVVHIPNCVDSQIFHPLRKRQAREVLGLPEKAKIVLFGAFGATTDYNKGYDLLRQALCWIADVPQVHALVFGASGSQEVLPVPATFLGALHDAIALRLTYAAADVFVCPSRQENLPNTILESLACGTPVAAFAVGGIPDMVEHNVNGCLATPHDSEELARGIMYILENDERRDRMGEAARKVVEERYAAPVVARQYMALYEEVLEQSRAKAR